MSKWCPIPVRKAARIGTIMFSLACSSEPKRRALVAGYLAGHDFSEHTRRAIRNDLRKFVRWFTQANGEVFTIKRVTLRDVTDFRKLPASRSASGGRQHQSCVGLDSPLLRLARSAGQAALESSKGVKELRRQPLAPKGT